MPAQDVHAHAYLKALVDQLDALERENAALSNLASYSESIGMAPNEINERIKVNQTKSSEVLSRVGELMTQLVRPRIADF